MSEIAAPLSIYVYPNPATAEIKIQNLKSEFGEVTIYDMVGKKVFQSQISNLKSQFRIDVSPLNVGIYFLRIQTAESIQSMKIVIAR